MSGVGVAFAGFRTGLGCRAPGVQPAERAQPLRRWRHRITIMSKSPPVMRQRLRAGVKINAWNWGGGSVYPMDTREGR